MIIHRSRFLTRGEVWYDDVPPCGARVDWIVYYRRSQPVSRSKWKYTHTPMIDLSKTVEQLKEQLSTDTAYKIRRASERDKVRCGSLNAADPEILNQFEAMYNEFAGQRGLSPLERDRITSLAAAGRLDLSGATDQQGNLLVYHGSYLGQHRATSLYSVSLFRTMADSAARSLISRANRYLFWSDILRYKELGLNSFDFGGWHTGTNEALLKINRFKDGFGGEIIREYQCEQIVSLKGWLVLKVAAVLNGARLLPAALRAACQPGTGEQAAEGSEAPLPRPASGPGIPVLAGDGRGPGRQA
jgi:hypothetical protein